MNTMVSVAIVRSRPDHARDLQAPRAATPKGARPRAAYRQGRPAGPLRSHVFPVRLTRTPGPRPAVGVDSAFGADEYYSVSCDARTVPALEAHR
jgi:hypothetical protein